MLQNKSVRFPNYLFRLRRLRCYSQKQFAGLLGLTSRKTVSDLEAGRRLPPLAIGLTMELVLGTRLSEIYPDLYGHLGQQAVTREDRLPPRFSRHIRGRVLRKD
jgi:transcriptional regulator with XRE-family HTH domain